MSFHLGPQIKQVFAESQAAFDYVTVAIRNYHDCGNTTNMHPVLAILAAILDGLGCCESATTIAGFAFTNLTTVDFPEIDTATTHLHEVLGDQTYESLARKGGAMTTAAMATYAYDQIDQARVILRRPG